jgi:hypothetical protein
VPKVTTRDIGLIFAGAAVGAGAAVNADKLPAAVLVRSRGSSVADPGALLLTRRLLIAGYFGKPAAERDLADLRLVFAILATHWHRRGYRRVGWRDIPAYERAFGPIVLRPFRRTRILSRADLLAGAARLLGDWFPEAWADDARRAWGVVFETVEDRARYRPERRLAVAAYGPLAPPLAQDGLLVWHAYPPVPVPSVAAARRVLASPPDWPDAATELGRFTPVLDLGLLGQTFEVAVVPDLLLLLPTRGYVTVTRVLDGARSVDLAAAIQRLDDGLAATGQGPALPPAAVPHLLVELTTHLGHFMGRGRNHLLLYDDAGRAFLRAVGCWDPMRWYVDEAYRRRGAAAQQRFWGGGPPEQSMLHQIARLASVAG